MQQSKQNPYTANATMKMLGHNSAVMVCKPIESQINDVISARPYTTTFETALDMVMLGYITGIRAERKRRKESQEKAIGRISATDEHKKKIIETLEKIDGVERLTKIYTVVETHLKLQNGEI